MDLLALAITLDEGRVAEILIDRAWRRARDADPASRLAVARRRGDIALRFAIDDDLGDLAACVKRQRDRVACEGADARDAEALVAAELLAGATGRARKAAAALEGFAQALVAFVTRPTAKTRASVEPHLQDPDKRELVARLGVQRAWEWAPADAAALVAARTALVDVARAIRLQMAALRGADRRDEADRVLTAWSASHEGAPDEHARHVIERVRAASASPEQALVLRARALERVTAWFADDELVTPALWALSADAAHARAHDVAAEACRRLEAILARRKGKPAAEERLYVLGRLRSVLIAARRFDEALSCVAVEEEVSVRLGRPTPLHLARAAVATASGDHRLALALHEQAVARIEAGSGPGEGPNGSNTDLYRAWLEQARERAARG